MNCKSNCGSIDPNALYLRENRTSSMVKECGMDHKFAWRNRPTNLPTFCILSIQCTSFINIFLSLLKLLKRCVKSMLFELKIYNYNTPNWYYLQTCSNIVHFVICHLQPTYINKQFNDDSMTRFLHLKLFVY